MNAESNQTKAIMEYRALHIFNRWSGSSQSPGIMSLLTDDQRGLVDSIESDVEKSEFSPEEYGQALMVVARKMAARTAEHELDEEAD